MEDNYDEDENHSGSEYENSEDSQSILSIDQDLLNHPLLSCRDDNILSIIIGVFQDLTKASPSAEKLAEFDLKTKLYKEVFGSNKISELHNEFKSLNLTHQTICGKLIPINDIYFRCLDCDTHTNPAFISLLCSGCFEKSNHDGHRLLIVKKENNSSATCDCGDADVFKPEGFCPEHQPKEVDIDELLKKFPKVTLERCQNVLRKAIYGTISLFEIAQKAKVSPVQNQLIKFAEQCLDQVLQFCISCYLEINEAFLPILSLLFRDYFLPDFNRVWHNCEDLKAEVKPNQVDVNKPHKCGCTILGNLLRLGNIMDRAQQAKVHKILIECSKESKFKEFLLLEFTKYIHFLYNQDYTSDDYEDNVNSRLLNMKTQLYSRDNLLMMILDSGLFPNLLSVMKRVIHGAPQVNHEVYHIVADLRSAILYFLNPKYESATRLIQKSDLMMEMLEVLMNFQVKFFYEGEIKIGLYEHKVEYRSINCGLMTEKVISQVLESGIKLICEAPQSEKITLAKQFAGNWYQNFLTSKEILDFELRTSNLVTFHPALERIFSCLIRNYMQDISINGIETFFKEALPDVNPNEVSQNVLEGVLRTLGMVRYLHMVHNYKGGMLWYVYYFFNNVFFEIDVVSAQIMTMMTKPEALFEVYVKNFFSYSKELQDFFSDPASLKTGDYFKQKRAVLEDFLHFLIYVMNDEICLLNLGLKDSHSFHEETKVDANYKRVVEKVLINLLLGHYWTDLPHLKEVLKDVLKEQHEVDVIIPKITVIDEKNHKIRLKDEYEQELDPYMFYRTPYIQRDIISNVASKTKKNEQIDLVAGKMHSDLPQHLKAIQRNIYQSELPKFLKTFLTKFNQDTAPLVRPALKLILLNLQVVNESLHHASTSNEELKKKAGQTYMNEDFLNILKEILQKEGFKDCKPCIEKIQDLIKNLMIKLNQKSDIVTEGIPEEEMEDPETLKKRNSKEKMERLKEEFAKKRQMFAEKNLELLSENSKIEESKIEDTQAVVQTMTCQYCLDTLNNTNEEYGVPIYIAFTNNLYDTESEIVFKEQDYTDLSGAHWWPVISSCNHHYHRKCFNIHFKNSRTPPDNLRKLLSNKYETYCSLCKTLCNNFLSLNPKLPSDASPQVISEEDKEKFPELFLTFEKKIEGVLNDMRKRLWAFSQNKMELENKSDNIDIEEILKRGYEYYLESFHFQNQAENLEKNFNLFIHLYSNFGTYLRDKKMTFNATPFQLRLFGKKNIALKTTEKEKGSVLISEHCESTLNIVFFELLVDFLCRGSEMDQANAVMTSHLEVLKEYLSFKITQLTCFEKKDIPLKLGDLWSFFKNSQVLKDIVITELVFPLQKIIIACCLNKHTLLNKSLPAEFCRLICNPGYDIEYLNKLLQQVWSEQTFEKLLEEAFFDLLKKSEAEVAPLSAMLALENVNKDFIRPRIVRLAPHILSLPPSYAEFNTCYFKKKCSLCNQFSKHLMTSVCLVCGEVMCQAYCDPSNKEYGNLNRHAIKCHMGLGLFLDMQHLSKTIISTPMNSIYNDKNVYIDKFGQAIQVFLQERRSILYSLDFKTFTLNTEFLDSLRGMVNNHTMGKEVFKVTQMTNYQYNNGNL